MFVFSLKSVSAFFTAKKYLISFMDSSDSLSARYVYLAISVLNHLIDHSIGPASGDFSALFKISLDQAIQDIDKDRQNNQS
jgi:hypothetical protein